VSGANLASARVPGRFDLPCWVRDRDRMRRGIVLPGRLGRGDSLSGGACLRGELQLAASGARCGACGVGVDLRDGALNERRARVERRSTRDVSFAS